jgi:ribosomal protein S12 methylthiotransferase accessory factor
MVENCPKDFGLSAHVQGTEKTYCRGTHRTVPPAVTLERVKPYMREMGITRIGNLTGLDVVGIPVAQAMRPNARSNSVSQGKGLDLEAAKASALMEAVETFHAEGQRHPLRFASSAEMRRHSRCADISRLSRAPGSNFHDGLDLLWIEGRDLVGGESVWVPYECVHSRFKLPFPPGSGCFPMTTSGLASGNNKVEAIVHGLCEVVERDATALFHLQTSRRVERRVALDSVEDEDCLELIACFERAGITVALWDITSDVGIPTFWCLAMEVEEDARMLARPAEGYGCHPDKAIALARALTEAAQARVTVIAGARDDLFSSSYRRDSSRADVHAWREIAEVENGRMPYGDIGSFAAPTLEADLEGMLERLLARGVKEVIAVELCEDVDRPYSVVRIVVPGLEGIIGEACLPGERARSLLRSR